MAPQEPLLEKTYPILDSGRLNQGDSSNQPIDEWKAVKAAVETALPFYEWISDVISLGLAGPLRRRAISKLEESRNEWVLDSGAGPGVSSRMLLEYGFDKIVGLDPSVILLRSAKTQLKQRFNPILGVAESLPLRNESMGGVITCFSLRDVRDRQESIGEFGRVVKKDGRVEIVDVGKPQNALLRGLIGVYIVSAMPILARLFIRRRSMRNPFRMIIPTFYRLPTNWNLARLVEQKFGSAKLHEFLFGGLIVLEAQKTTATAVGVVHYLRSLK